MVSKRKVIGSRKGKVEELTKRMKELEARETELTDEIVLLRKDRERYRTIFENTFVPIVVEDYTELKEAIDELKSNGVTDFRRYLDEHPEFVEQAPLRVKVVDINSATLKHIEAKTKKRILNGLLEKLTLKETHAMLKGVIVALSEGKKTFEGETVMQTLKGKRKNILFKLMISGEKRSPYTWIVSWIDITERKRSEEALLESENRFSTFMDHVPGRVFIKDENLNLIYVNKFIRDFHGDKDWYGKPLEELIPKELAQRLNAGSRKTLLKGLSETMETIPDKNGENHTYRKFEFRMLREGKAPLLGGIAIDITKQVEAEDALLESHNRLETEVERRTYELVKANESLLDQTRRNELILKTALDGFFVVNTNGKILKANPAASIIYGYSNDELIGKRIIDLAAEDCAHLYEDYAQGARKIGGEKYEVRHINKDGLRIDLEVSENYVETGAEQFFFSFFHEITKRKQAEKALLEREKELETKTVNLEEMNAALKVLLRKRDEDKTELEEKVLFNMKELVLPYLEKLKKLGLDKRQEAYADILESNLMDITSSFSKKLSISYLSLTPTEIQVADLVRAGSTSKEIAEVMSLSVRTVDAYRDSIRGKLGLKNKKANLKTHLLSLQ